MRTTNKIFKEQVRNHIHEIIDLEPYGIEADNPVKAVHEIFKTEKVEHDNQFAAGKIGEKQLFNEWVTGLPSSFNVHFTNHDIENQLKTWWENAGESFNPDKMQQDPSDLYFHLVTREFYSMLNKEGK